MTEDNPLTPARRKHFESLGEEVVRQDLAAGGSVHIGGPTARKAAAQWLQEFEEKREGQRAEMRGWVKMGVILALIALFVMIMSIRPFTLTPVN